MVQEFPRTALFAELVPHSSHFCFEKCYCNFSSLSLSLSSSSARRALEDGCRRAGGVSWRRQDRGGPRDPGKEMCCAPCNDARGYGTVPLYMSRHLAACTRTLTFRRAGRGLLGDRGARRSTPSRKTALRGTLQAADRLRWCTPVHEPDPGHVQQSFYHSLDTPSVVIDVRRPMGVPAARLGHAYDTRASAWAWASAQAHWGSYGFGTTMEQLWNNY